MENEVITNVTETVETTTKSTVQVKTKKHKVKIPKIFKDKRFIFIFTLILFLASFFVLFLMDRNNAFRPAALDNSFFLHLLEYFGFKPGSGLDIGDVNMATWFIFFLFFGVFFVFYFVFLFRSMMLEAKKDKIYQIHNREATKGEIRKFKFWFWFIVILVLAAGITGVLVWLYNGSADAQKMIDIVSRQLSSTNVGITLLKTLAATLILIIFWLTIPVAMVLILVIFKLVILIISFIVGGVSEAVVSSEAYQRSMAASQAAANDLSESMRRARDGAGDALARAHAAQDGQPLKVTQDRSMAPQADIIFPALTNIDIKWAEIEKKKAEEEAKAKELAAATAAVENKIDALGQKEGEEVAQGDNLAIANNARPPLDYEQFRVLAYEFQSYLCHQKFYFNINVIRSFIAGFSAARLLLLEGLSGTGKSTLPRVFLEYVGGKAYFFPVQATWRDRSDITGYYSDFTGAFKETELLKHLYEARYTPETINLMVLDEMNISRVEYYFADFLSIFEYPAEDWVVPLMQVKPETKLPKYIENGMVRIPENTWFVGTVNIDDSTFTITDKVYDRAIVIDFQELNMPFESSYRFDPHPIHLQELTKMFEECKAKPENNLTDSERLKFLQLTQFIGDTFDIQFGNRIMNQVDNFLPVFVGLGGTKEEALDIMFARKILRKLDGKFESYIKDGLNKLTRYLNTEYGKHVFTETEKLIEKFRKKLS